MQVYTKSVAETISIGRSLGRILSSGDVVCLTGELGAGKTYFVKGLAGGLGVIGIRGKGVTSPTFIIIREYKGRLPLYHIDLYRIGVVEDLRDIGMEEVIYGRGVTAIEWAERIADRLPDERIEITLRYEDKKTRLIEMTAFGRHHTQVLKKTAGELEKIADKR
ncbi:MAG: tRNA (adenosine(37)-N6)-threonylcarbamoyltransferase complex ATPase subunit type 1 TsaE [Nitrospirae bacterium]|nr:tRNA (adenosine(37)-N6)-threonylcarbamoyltransferase complex ATPase subunit type 1 TsaE [Nitrospirota bacterium]MBI5097411.1 tRNA (adenosine(37)-N6)-threonylcarbamoyltransferase complex ATPase subunit type 1 TsaE [Nitrospirota bacterium]